MECPKCQGEMTQVSYGNQVEVDRCNDCRGIWFDSGETEKLAGKWNSDSLDTGNPIVGAQMNERQDIDCPRCQNPMETHHQGGVSFEACHEHGVFFDAGEFSTQQHNSFMEKLKGFSAN